MGLSAGSLATLTAASGMFEEALLLTPHSTHITTLLEAARKVGRLFHAIYLGLPTDGFLHQGSD